jgi:LssY C-terminus
MRRILIGIGVLVGIYLAAAYVIVPYGWKEYAERHPAFDDDPRITRTSDGHPGDPLNVSLIGSEQSVLEAMMAIKWYHADPLGADDDLRIAADSVFARPYDAAPVSSLYLFGRKEDLAFEQPLGDDPRKRNHVRLWNTGKMDENGRPIWIGAASYDDRIGLSHTTGQVTHHIAPDVDTERDRIFDDLTKANAVTRVYQIPGYHRQLEGRNGGGDRWYTDGALWVGVVNPDLRQVKAIPAAP